MTDDPKATSSEQEHQPPKPKRRLGITIFAIVGVLVVIAALVGGTFAYYEVRKTNNTIAKEQEKLDPFYTPPAQIPAKPGTVIRVEEIAGVDLPNGTAYRVLYASRDKDNKPVAVGGQFWVSTKPVPAGGRKVLGWAHGTVGLADQCAPSRSKNPLQDTDNWLNVAMENGYVVAATDYLGLGTPYPPTYLVGRQEATDVVNSVRAIKNFVKEPTTNKWIVWGHSQGGHSALWTAALAEQLAPELELIATGAAAPAQQLSVIVANQWPTAVGWAIGPEALLSFEHQYPDGNFRGVISEVGKQRLDSILGQCIMAAGFQGLAINELGGKFFTSDPIYSPAWAKAVLAQTPPVLPPSMPLFMSEGTADTVVLSGSNALMQEQWCRAGSNLTVEWLGNVGHLQVAMASGPAFMEWAQARWQGKPTQPNCSYPPASPALTPVKIPPQVLAAPVTEATVSIPGVNPTATFNPSPSPSN